MGVYTERIRVVVIDDSEDVRLLVGSLLQWDGRFEVVGEAASGEAGLVTVARTRPDVVLLDLVLGGASGLEVLPRLASAEGAVAVVVLTAWPDPGLRDRVRDAGAVDLVDKARAISDLAEALVAAAAGALAPVG